MQRLALVVAVLIAASPAGAETRVLGPAALDDERVGAGPALDRGAVVWAEAADARGVTIRTDGRELGRAPHSARSSLGAAGGRVAYATETGDDPARTVVRVGSGPLRPLPPLAGGAGVWGTGDELVAVFEPAPRQSRLLRVGDAGAEGLLDLPERLAQIDAVGPFVAWAQSDGPVTVLDRRDGTTRQLRAEPPSYGPIRFFPGNGLSVDADGAALHLVEARRLYHAPAGASAFVRLRWRVLATLAFLRGTRVALIERTAGGERAVVRALADGTVLWRSPLTSRIRSLDFDGTRVAWSTPSCLVVASIDDAAAARLPPGRCVRTDLLVFRAPDEKGRSTRYHLRCLDASGRDCLVRFRRRSRTVAVHRIPRGAGRGVVVPGRRARPGGPALTAEVREGRWRYGFDPSDWTRYGT